jgi:hypothetical protein
MRKLALIALTAAMFSGTTAADAGGLGHPCTTAPQTQWLSLEALQTKVEALGYKVQKAKLKNACGESTRSTRMAPASNCSSIPPAAKSPVSFSGVCHDERR